MHCTQVLLSLALLVLSAAAGSAQQAAPAAAPTRDAATSVAPTAAAQPVDRTALHVTGLTQLNAGVAEIALEGIAHQAWRCVGCELDQPAPGPCPVCHQDATASEETLLCDVILDQEAGTVHFDVLPGQRVRLTEIEAAVKRYKIAFPREQQFIPRAATLVVTGPGSKEDVAKLVTQLAESKLFDNVSGSYLAPQSQAELTVRCAACPAFGEVDTALARIGTNYKLADVIWSAGTSAHAAAR